jgi:hypothetical protein
MQTSPFNIFEISKGGDFLEVSKSMREKKQGKNVVPFNI